MPINYKKYPDNWLSEIRPRILKRDGYRCRHENCDFKHGEYVWSVRYKGKVTGWYRSFLEADKQDKTGYSKYNFKTKKTCLVPNPKKVKVIITVAHLDHDESNPDVQDDRLLSMCQICHLRYDAKEKYRRRKDGYYKNR